MKSPVFQLLAAFLLVMGSTFGQNPRMHLIEDGTFNSCGHCPCNDSVIRHNVIPRVPNTSFIRYHFSWSGLHSVGCDSVLNQLVMSKTAFNVDRNGMVFPEPEWVKEYNNLCDNIVDVMQKDNEAPLKIMLKSKGYNSQTRELSFSVDFVPYQTDLNGIFKVNAVLTENKILFQQAFLDSCGKDPQGKYLIRHNDVARKMSFTPYSDLLKSGVWGQSQTITRDFTMAVDTGWLPENCEFTVYVYKEADSLYKSKIQQAMKEAVTSPLGFRQPGFIPGEIRVFPVPARDRVNAHLSFPEMGTAEVSIVDQSGRIVKEFRALRLDREMYNFEFSVKDFTPGIYFIKVKMGGKTTSQKFLVSD